MITLHESNACIHHIAAVAHSAAFTKDGQRAVSDSVQSRV